MRLPSPRSPARQVRTLLLCLTLALVAATCAPGGGQVGPGCVDAPLQWTLPSSIPEASGVAVSRRHPGVLWVHNDGRDSTLWALVPDSTPERTEIAPVARVKVAAEIWDWEALEVDACPAGIDAESCVWVADTGNNGLYREVVRLQVLAEPDLVAGSMAGDAPVVTPLVLHLRYPDARRDVEAMFVVDGTPWLVSKGNTGAATLYRVPLPPTWTNPALVGRRASEAVEPGAGVRAPVGTRDNPVTVEKVQELAPGGLNMVRQFTGAAAIPTRPDARRPAQQRMVLRSYTQLRLFSLTDTGAVAVQGGEVNLMPLREAQGEGVAVGADGRVWLVTESGPTAGRGGLSVVRCEELATGEPRR